MKIIYQLLVLASFVTGCTKATEPQPTPLDESSSARARVPLVVILGSSTASGSGASNNSVSWAGQFKAYYAPKGQVVNLAVPGYTTYHILPTNTAQVANRPAVDTLHNITAALKKSPTILIISMTTNDVGNGFSVDELMNNLKTVRALALADGVKQVYITTCHPRKINAAATVKFLEQRDRIMSLYGKYGINFFDPVADANNLFRAEWLFTDGIHPNDKGHAVLFEQVRTAFEQP